MKYVFDSGPIINLKYYYSNIFTSFWLRFDELIADQLIISAMEVYNELSSRGDFISDWAEEHKEIFLVPTVEELNVARDILSDHRELLKSKNIKGGLPVADPFIIAQGYCRNLIVVSNEQFTPNAHKIPNICRELNIHHMNFDAFMENEGWSF